MTQGINLYAQVQHARVEKNAHKIYVKKNTSFMLVRKIAQESKSFNKNHSFKKPRQDFTCWAL